MIIYETCPECGHVLEMLTLTMNPPIPARRCPKCGWYWQGQPAQIEYRPFNPEDYNNNVCCC